MLEHGWLQILLYGLAMHLYVKRQATCWYGLDSGQKQAWAHAYQCEEPNSDDEHAGLVVRQQKMTSKPKQGTWGRG